MLSLQSGKTIFTAELETTGAGGGFQELENGSFVELTGICVVYADENGSPTGFAILLRSGADWVVIKQPPWWTIKRLIGALATSVIVGLAALVWVAVLRRRVHGQTEVIRRQLENEAALEQRFRYAARATQDAIWEWDLQTGAR